MYECAPCIRTPDIRAFVSINRFFDVRRFTRDLACSCCQSEDVSPKIVDTYDRAVCGVGIQANVADIPQLEAVCERKTMGTV